jgi:hypothetical protein
MKITILHPSRSRPQQAAKTAKAWLSSAKDIENVDYLICVDEDERHWHEYDELTDKLNISVCTNANKSAIEAINYGASLLDEYDLLIVVSDDFNTPPYHWDEALRTALAGKSDYLVKTNDGLQPWIITLPIMDRVYYERFGYVYHPDYQHMFCDTEMTHVGHMLGKVIELPIVIKHNHYAAGLSKKDAINEKNDATWNQGEKVYLDNLMRNFDIPDNEIVNPINHVHASHLNWLHSKGISFVTT